MFTTSGKANILLVIPAIEFIWLYSTKLQWNPLHINPPLISMDGITATKESSLEPIGGGKSKITVSLRKKYVPQNQWYRLDGIKGLMSHLSGNVQYDIIDYTEKFVAIEGKHLGAEEGSVLYLGSISDKPVLPIFEKFTEKLYQKDNEIMNLSTVIETTRQLAHSMAKSNNQDIKEVAKDLALVLRDVSKSVETTRAIREVNKNE